MGLLDYVSSADKKFREQYAKEAQSGGLLGALERIPQQISGYATGAVDALSTPEGRYRAMMMLPGAALVTGPDEMKRYWSEYKTAPDASGKAMALAGLLGTGLDVVTSAPALGMIAYHGSPHKFEKFSKEFMGSGEGAQAYGHGLYFAENPNVAKQYMELGIQNKPIVMYNHPAHPGKSVVIRGEDILSVHKTSNAANRALSKMQEPSRNLYKVDIADEAAKNFLDWDAPLSKQPNVIEKLTPENLGIKPKVLDNGNYAFVLPNGKPIGPVQTGGDFKKFQENWLKNYDIGNLTGRELIDRFGQGDKELASKVLNQAGIKGIRYKDQLSREAGKGTSNFVVFDEDIIKTLERNNKPVQGLLNQ